MGMITKLDRTGHSTLAEWEQDDTIKIKTAEELFGDLQKTGHALVKVEPDENGPDIGTQITKFDPDADEIMAIPARVGG